MSPAGDVTHQQLRACFRIAQAAVFVDIAVLLVPIEAVRGAVLVLTAPAVAAFGLALIVNWRGSIDAVRQALTGGSSALGQLTAEWPVYFWRAMGVSVALIGLTMSIVGVVDVLP